MWVNKETAKELGMTHEGTLHGIAVWLRFIDLNEFNSIPKFIPFAGWLWFCETLYELATYFMTEDQVLETPLTVGDRI